MSSWRSVAFLSARAFLYPLSNPGRIFHAFRHPRKVALYLRLLRLPLELRPLAKSGPQFFHLLTKEDPPRLEGYARELASSTFYHDLLANLHQAERSLMARPRGRGPHLSVGHLDGHGSRDAGICLYSLVRALRPRSVVETGVANGESSAIILKALDINGAGHLYSIDLLPPQPSPELAASSGLYLPPNAGIGWLVPQELRRRWRFLSGDAREVLPPLLKELGWIDMFLHDSHHSYEHMLFEYESAWARLRPGGLLLSDDCWCPAFADFQRRTGAQGAIYGSLGALCKGQEDSGAATAAKAPEASGKR